MKYPQFLSVVLYVRNNSDIIEEKILLLNEKIKQNFSNYEIIIVDDSSNDELIAKLFKIKDVLHGKTRIVETAWALGKESAIFTGEKASIGDFVFQIDNIHFINDSLIENFFKALDSGSDIAIFCVKNNPDLLATIFYYILNHFSNSNIILKAEVGRLISRRALNTISKYDNPFRYNKSVYPLTGFKYKIIKTDVDKYPDHERKLFSQIDKAITLLLMYTEFGFRFAFYTSAIFGTFSVLSSIYVVYNYLFNSHVETGWTSTNFILTFSFSGLFILLTIITKYLQILIALISKFDTSKIKSNELLTNVYKI